MILARGSPGFLLALLLLLLLLLLSQEDRENRMDWLTHTQPPPATLHIPPLLRVRVPFRDGCRGVKLERAFINPHANQHANHCLGHSVLVGPARRSRRNIF